MAANGYSVTITAVDRASKQIDEINRRIAAARAPITNMEKSLTKLAENSGLRNVAAGMRQVATASLSAFEGLDRMAPLLGTFTAAGTAAAVARMAGAWADFGARLTYSSQRIGVSTDRLQALQGAARLAGASAEGLTVGMRTLRDGMIMASAGRAPEVITVMNQLGIKMRDARGQIRGAADVLPEAADQIKNLSDSTRQAYAAQILFGASAEDLLPFLRRGSVGIKELADQARRYGTINDRTAQQAVSFKSSIENAKLASEGLANAIGQALAPQFQPILDGTSAWVAKNKDLIATDVAGWASDYLAVIRPIAGALDAVVTSTVGWNTALEIGIPAAVAASIPALRRFELQLLALVGYRLPGWMLRMLGIGTSAASAGVITMLWPNQSIQSGSDESTALSKAIDQMNKERQRVGLPPLPRSPMPSGGDLSRQVYADSRGPARLSSVQIADNTEAARRFFLSRGWTAAQTAGLLANMQRESSFDPATVGDDGTSFGLFQWHGDRIARFNQWARGHGISHGLALAGLDEQLRFANWEMTKGPEKAAGDALRRARDAREAAEIVSRSYERPSADVAEARLRGDLAPRFLGAPVMLPAALPPAALSGTAQVNVRVEMERGLRTTTTATADGELFTGAPKVDSVMGGSMLP